MAVAEILEVGEKLLEGKVRLRDIVRGADPPDESVNRPEGGGMIISEPLSGEEKMARAIAAAKDEAGKSPRAIRSLVMLAMAVPDAIDSKQPRAPH